MSAPIPPPASRACDELTTGSVLLTLAATTLGLALQYSSGILSSIGIAGLTLAFAEAWAAQGRWHSKATANAASIAGLCIGAEVAMLLTDDAAQLRGNAGQIVVVLSVAAGSVAGLCFVVHRHLHARLLACIALLASVSGWWVLRQSPVPGIDVLSFQRDAAAALLSGTNPYSIHFRDPYPPAASALFDGPGVSVNGVLRFGYPYMPLTLLLALPGYLLGDVRYASLCAVVLAACLIGFARPSWSSVVGAVLLLLSPAVPIMIVHGWNDSFVVLFVAAVWFCHCRRPAALPYVVGMLFVTKQYLIVAAPLVLLLVDRPWHWRNLWSFFWRAALAGAVVTLPFVLWDPRAFFASLATLQMRQPFRPDALSYIAWLNPAEPARWILLPFVLSTVTCIVLLRRSRSEPVSFAAAMVLTMLPFFAFNQQAFLNHYFLVLGCICCAIASGTPWHREPETRTYAPGTRGEAGLRLM